MDHSLAAVLKHTWSIVEGIVSSRATEEKTITLATVDPKNQPQACSVILRGVNTMERLFEFYTDADSLKYNSLSRNPKAQILIWKPEIAVQLRFSVEIRLIQDQKSAKIWKKIPVKSQTNYGKDPSTGTHIERPHAYKMLSTGNKFVIAQCKIQKIDFLSLKQSHLRAQFSFDDDWVGHWKVP